MTKLKTVNIKGKEYVEVNTRIKYFRQNFKDWSLTSELVELTNESVLIKAVIRNPEGRIIASGYAQEEKSSSYINKTSFIENCETSAWGRALGNLGIGIDSSVASYEEVKTAIQKQETQTPKKAKQGAVLTPNDSERWSKAIEYVFENSLAKLEEYYTISKQDKERLSIEVWSYMKTLAVEKGVDYVLERKEMSQEMQKEFIDSIYSDYENEEMDLHYREQIALEYHNNRGNS